MTALARVMGVYICIYTYIYLSVYRSIYHTYVCVCVLCVCVQERNFLIDQQSQIRMMLPVVTLPRPVSLLFVLRTCVRACA